MFEVDLVIPVHSVTRPIKRAVASVLEHNQTSTRIIVVAHNLPQELIESNLEEYSTDSRVSVYSLIDGIRSPAGPMNLGFSVSTAPYVSLMGSDDTLAPGAIDSWMKLQRATDAEFIIAPILMVDGRIDPYPPVRAGKRTTKLHPVKDRLFYRSAPLGLISSKQVQNLSFSTGMGSGEDLFFTLSLIFQSKRIAYDLTGPPYVIGTAIDRVTSQTREIAEDFRFVEEISNSSWFKNSNKATKRAIVLKILRIHLFDAIGARISDQKEFERNKQDFLSTYSRLNKLAPTAKKYLSKADYETLEALKNPETDVVSFKKNLDARWIYRALPTLLTANPLLSLTRQGPFRTQEAGFRVTNSFLKN